MSRKERGKGRAWPPAQEEERERQSLANCPGRGKGKAELGLLSWKRKMKGRALPHVQ
jgi:hypothetical protein